MLPAGISNLDKSSPCPYVLGKNPGRAFIDAPGNGGFATAPDLVRFAHGRGRHGAGPRSTSSTASGCTSGAGGNRGIAANWDIHPYTGWVGVILSNCDGVPLQEMIGREMQAITGASPGEGSGS